MRWFGYSLAAVLIAGFAWLAWASVRLTSVEGAQIPRVLVDVTVQRLIHDLQTPPSTAARLGAELARARVVPRREALLARVDLHAAEIDRLGAQRQDLQILDLLTPEATRPEAAEPQLPDPQREALRQVLALVRSPGYLDMHTDRRVSAASTLGMLQSEAGLLALLGVLENPTEPRHLKESVAEALEQLQDFRAVRAVERYRRVPPTAEFGQVGLEVQLASSSRSVRRRAIETLGEAQDAGATGLLLQALDDPDPELRALAIKEMRGREDERIQPALIALIAREREHERSPLYFAIEALRGHQSPEVVDALLRAYRRLPAQRALLLGALAERADPRGVDVLLEALRDPNAELRFAAKQGLISLASRQPDLVIESLIFMLASKAPLEAKRTASDVLGRSTGQDFGLDVATWDEWYRRGRR